MKKLRVVPIILLTILISSNLFAQSSPIQLAVWRTVQIVPEAESVGAFRLSIYSVNAGMTGLDLGIWNETRSLTQVGLQMGIVGKSLGGFQGWQANAVNISANLFEGFQSGWVNHHSGRFSGLQIAIVNYAETMNGIQLGLINIIKKGGFMPWFPIVNWAFD
ncbi:MAG: hypothetical protein KAQ90_09535 [Melioribacteraceae bacterium]|nr:hypothetical protein [Melioribacteraceae bacterium]